MAIKNTLLGGSNFATPSARVKPTDLNDTFDAAAKWIDANGMLFKYYAQLLFNSARIGFNSKLNVATGVPNLKNIKYDVFNSDTATTKTNFTFDNTNKFYYVPFGAGNATLIFQTSGLSTIKDCIPTWNYLFPQTYEYTTNCDFTAASLPAGYTLNTSQNGGATPAATWDAANDEVDLSANGTDYSYHRYSSAWFQYNTGLGYGVMKVNITKLTASSGGSSSGVNGIGTLTFGPYTISVVNGANYSNTCYYSMSDGTNSVDWSTSPPQNLWLKVTRLNGYFRNEYSTTGDSNYTVLTEGYSGTASLGTPKIQVNTPYDNGAASKSIECSVNNFTFNTTATDSDNTLTVSISADGTNYEEVTDATIHRFTNTGTNLYVKFEIDRVDTTAVDKISEYAVWYNTGIA